MDEIRFQEWRYRWSCWEEAAEAMKVSVPPQTEPKSDAHFQKARNQQAEPLHSVTVTTREG